MMIMIIKFSTKVYKYLTILLYSLFDERIGEGGS
uniref:Uncharacterized protein n=1 Tax=Lepeophtheirus salmonis TaxID=72036 RepID=A0A0K2V044_LEPSM